MKKQIQSIHHFFVAIILLAKGLAKIQHHHSLIGWTILLLGVLFLLYFLWIKQTKKSNILLEFSMHIFESLALFLTTYVYYQEGKTYLPYVTLVAGIGFLAAALLHVKDLKTHKP